MRGMSSCRACPWKTPSCARRILRPTRKGEGASLTVEVSAPSVLRAPLSAGEIVGEAVAMREGEAVARVPLVLTQDLPGRSYRSSLGEVLCLWMQCAAQDGI